MTAKPARIEAFEWAAKPARIEAVEWQLNLQTSKLLNDS